MKNEYVEKLLQYAFEKHGTKPEYPWAKDDESAVLRHSGNKKWYGLIMCVRKDRLGLMGTGSIYVLNVKCDPILIGSLRTENGYLPAYHMNKEKWLTVMLDGTLALEEIIKMLEFSFELTDSKKPLK